MKSSRRLSATGLLLALALPSMTLSVGACTSESTRTVTDAGLDSSLLDANRDTGTDSQSVRDSNTDDTSISDSAAADSSTGRDAMFEDGSVGANFLPIPTTPNTWRVVVEGADAPFANYDVTTVGAFGTPRSFYKASTVEWQADMLEPNGGNAVLRVDMPPNFDRNVSYAVSPNADQQVRLTLAPSGGEVAQGRALDGSMIVTEWSNSEGSIKGTAFGVVTLTNGTMLNVKTSFYLQLPTITE